MLLKCKPGFCEFVAYSSPWIAYGIARNPKKDGYQRTLASIVYKFFDK